MAHSPLIPKAGFRDVLAKLERANESIQNLNSEIVAFLKERPEGVFSENKQQAAIELTKFHVERGIPPRFAVIAGEIAHHLRSCLDYIAWLLSTEGYRRDHERSISFPIVTEKPRNKDERASYRRKVKGILSKDARSLIERLQPYNTGNPPEDPLAVLNELDREDKHHTLVLVVVAWDMTFSVPLSLLSTFTISPFYGQVERPNPALAAKPKVEFCPNIAFGQIGRWKGGPVIQALTHLLDTVKDDLQRFSELQT
jgi:hypothetical protein